MDKDFLKNQIRWANREYGVGVEYSHHFSNRSGEFGINSLLYF
jgi:hypothetical protein